MRPSVLMMTHWLSRTNGGVSEVVREVGAAMERDSLARVKVVGLWDERWAEDRTHWGDADAEAFRCVGPASIGYSPSLSRRILEQADFDLIHLHGLWKWPSRAVHRTARRRGLPHVVSPHGMLDRWALDQSKWKKRLIAAAYERRNLQSATAMVALCEAEVQSIRDFGITSPVAVISNGVALPDLTISPKASRKTILFLGRLHSKKGIELLIAAFAALPNELKDLWRVEIAGWGADDYVKQLKSMASSMRLNDCIEFTGPVMGEAKADAYRRCDVFALTSYSEGVPMSVLEAWSYGKPVLMTEFCNLPIGFERGAAVRCEPSVESVLASLKRLIQSSEGDLRTMGMSGRLLVEEQFTWRRIAAQTAELYQWCFQKTVAPTFLRLV